MKFIKTFETSKLDNILDKINKSGINSLTQLEKDWLKFHAEDKEEDKEKIEKEMGEREFISSNQLFRFKFTEDEDYGNHQIYKGTLYVPDIVFEDGSIIEGILEGYIEVYDHNAMPNFQKEEFDHLYDSFDFCEGLEHEFQDFINYMYVPNNVDTSK